MNELNDLEAVVAARLRPYKLGAIGILLLALLFVGYLVGAYTSAPAKENIAPAAAQSQVDGSVVLEREPGASAPADAAKPKAALPKGSTLERQISVTVQPTRKVHVDASSTAQDVQCPDVKVDLSLVRQGDGRRVVASSPDGTVVGGIDVPIEAGVIPVDRPWAAGLSCEASRDCGKTLGVWVDRDLARVRVGAELVKREIGGVQARVKVGWVW